VVSHGIEYAKLVSLALRIPVVMIIRHLPSTDGELSLLREFPVLLGPDWTSFSSLLQVYLTSPNLYRLSLHPNTSSTPAELEPFIAPEVTMASRLSLRQFSAQRLRSIPRVPRAICCRTFTTSKGSENARSAFGLIHGLQSGPVLRYD
jgi:hypothetical protein